MTGPPDLHSVDTEAALIGETMIAPAEVLSSRTVAMLQPGDFWDSRHQAIWRGILALAAEDTEPDPVTLADLLKRRGEDINAADLMELAGSAVSHVAAEGHARIILDFAQRRQAEAVAGQFVAAIRRLEDPVAPSLDEALDKLSDVKFSRAAAVNYRDGHAIREYFGDVQWAWQSRLPVGHLSMFAGPQGDGKSYLVARLIATHTGAKGHWPDREKFTGKPGKVLLVETDEMRGPYVQRLEAMGVNLDLLVVGPGDETHIPNLLKEADQIERLARQENVVAVYADSLSGGHELREESAEMRKLLKRYAQMAARLQLPLTLVHHLRKKRELEAVNVTLDRVRGSSTITQFCRSVISVYRLEEGDQAGPVRVESIKSSFCAPPPPLGFTVTDAGLVFCDPPEPVREESQLDKAADLLLVLLDDGPKLSVDLQDEADGAGISWRTMKRAKTQLGIVAKREKDPDGHVRWYWALPANM